MSKKVLIERNGSGGVVSTVAIGDGLEFHGEWMSHGYVTVTVNSATEIAFAVGDFVEFAGRKFYLWDEESVKKQARSGSYGEAYVYDNIKLHEGTVALEQVSMHDVVLEDNGQTYSSLSRFSFFGATVDDLADRIQANLLRQSTAIGGDTLRFRLFTPDKTRTTGRMSNMGNVGTAWESYYTGNEATGKKDVAVSVQNETLWGALGHAYNDFELPYYVSSSNENDVDYIDIVIGGKAVEVSNSAFVYGKGHGLYEIERSADSDQRIVTKLFAYGSTENLPTNYYGNLYKVAYADCLQSDTFEIDGGNYYFVDAVTGSGILWSSVKDALGVRADVRPSPFSVGGHTPVGKSVTVRCNNTNYTASIWVYETGGEQYLSFKTETQAPVVLDTKFYILDGVDLLKWPNSKIDTAPGYPGGMAIMNLMLPGFPKQSLKEMVEYEKSHPSGNRPAWMDRAYNFTTDKYNYVLSNDPTDPWIQSANAAVYGIREGEVYFDGTDDRENIRPSIENTNFGTVASVTGITDDGWVDKTEGFVIRVLAANGGGDFWQAVWDAPHDDEVPLTMTSGYHNGREFKLTKVVVGTTYVELSVDRIQDESGRWVPNTEQPIVGRDLPTPQHDTFVVTGIQLPKEYIDAASEKLLMAAFDELDKIDHGLRTYQPRLDEIYMANEQATAEIESRASLHDTLRAGMVLKWQWEDYGTQGATVISSTIDVLTIKEDGNNGVPTYDVVLRDEKEKTLTEKIATVVSKTTGIGGGTAVRSDGGNADTAKKADRLSGDDEVSVWGQTYWQDGRPKDVSGSLEGVDDITMTGNLNLGDTGMGIDQSGDAVLNSVTIAETTTTTSGGTEATTEDKAVLTEDGLVVTEKVDNTVTKSTVVDENGMTIGTYAEGLFGTGGIFKMIDGKSYLEADRLYVRMKAYFDTLEIRRYIHSGGNRVASAAGCKVSRVEQESGNGSYFCYFKAKEDDNTITNDFVVGDLAYCHTTNLAGSNPDAELNQQYYWRLVMETGSVNAAGDIIVTNGATVGNPTDTTATEHYIKLANTTQPAGIPGGSYQGMMSGSTAPKEEDDIVQLGNVNDPTRRGAIIEAVSGMGYAPTYRIYQGIGADPNNLYVLPAPKIDMGYFQGSQTKSARAYINVYGDMYIGAEGNNPSTYIRYTQDGGTNDDPLLEIKAKIDATSGSSVANVFVGLATNISSYKENDILIVDGLVNPLNYQDENQYYKVVNGDVLIAIRDKGEQSLWKDWRKKDRYTDDAAFNSYVTSLLGEPGNKPSASATDAQKAAYLYNVIKKALGGTTTIDGGLMLTSTIMMRKLNENGNPTVLSDYTTWAGLNGVYDDAMESGDYVGAKGHGIAAWFGGEMADWEAYFESLTPAQQASAVISDAYAKSLFRFDGSGYLAGGNISWEDDGDTTVKGTVRADNLYHGVCFFHEEVGEIDHYSTETDPRTDNPYTNNGFISKKHYIDGNKRLSTGTCDVVFMIPYNSTNPWNRNATDEQDQNTYPNFYLDARTLTLPSPEDFKGKTIEVFIYTMGDLPDKVTTGANAGYGVEKQIKIRSLKIGADGNPVIDEETDEPICYPIVSAVGFDTTSGMPITLQEGDNYVVSKAPSVGYLRFQAARCKNTNNNVQKEEYAWIMSIGQGGVNITNIEGDVIYSQGADKEWVKKWVLAYLGGFGDGDDNWESQTQDDTPDIVGYLPLAGGTMDNTNLVTNLNADLLDGHDSNYFATRDALQGYMSTSERGNYVEIGGDSMTGDLNMSDTNKVTFGNASSKPYISKDSDANRLLLGGETRVNGNLLLSAGNALKANDIGADLLAYKSSTWGGVTGAHWFVGAAGVNGFIRSYGELKRWKDANTQYTIWDSSNLTPANFLTKAVADGYYLAINGNAASATKLQTARTIWGQSFDGTGNVTGALLGAGGTIDLQYNDEINRYGGNLYIQHRGSGLSGEGTGSGNNTGNVVMCANGGIVGIGVNPSNSATYKLCVNGDIKVGATDKLLFGSKEFFYDANDGLCINDGSENAPHVIYHTGNLNPSDFTNHINSIKVNGTTLVPDTNLAVNIDLTGYVTRTTGQTISGYKTFSNGLASGGNISMDALTEITFDIDSAVGINRNDVLYLHGNNGILLGDDTTVNGSIAVSNGLTSTSHAATTINHNGIDVTIGGFDATLIEYAAGDANYAIARFGIKPQVLTGSNTYSDVALVSDIGTVLTGISFSSTGQAYVFKKNVVTGEGTGELVNTPYALASSLSDCVAKNDMPFEYLRNQNSDDDETNGVIIRLIMPLTVTTISGTNKKQAQLNLSGYATTSALSGYLPLTAGSSHPLTGNIAYKGTKATYDMITFIDNVGDIYGNGIAIGGGGATIIGGGESAGTMSAQVSGGNEVMYIGNDQGVSIYTYLQSGWSYRKEFLFDTNGDFSLLSGVNGRKTRISADGGIYLTAGTSYWANGMYAMSQADASLGEVGFFGNGDALTYMYIGAAYNNTWMVVKPNGNVGIGTTQPDRKLHVNGDFGVGNVYAGSYLFMNANNAGIYMNSTGIAWHNSSNQWVADLMTFTSGGNAGIGTSPNYKLDVNGDIHTSANIRLDSDHIIYFKDSNNIWCDALSHSYDSSTGIDTLYLGWDFRKSLCATEIYGNKLAFFTGTKTDEIMVITSGGNVGIGTTSPSEKLSVVGNIESFGTNVGTTITPTGIDVRIGGFAATLIEYDTGDANYAIAKFGLRPQVLTGTNTYTNVALTTDIPSVPAGRSMYFGNCQIFTNSSGTAGTELYLSGNSVHVTSDGVFTFNNEQVVTSSGVAFASKSNNQWTLTVDHINTGHITATSFNFANTADSQGHGGSAISHVNNSSEKGILYNAGTNGNHYFKNWNSSGTELYANIHCLTCDETSDIRQKDVVEYLNPSVYDIANAPIIKFKWKDGGNDLHLGSISQYWEKTLPETVHIGDDLMQSMEKSTIALLAGITAARKTVDNERRIAELELRVAELEDLLAAQNDDTEMSE